MKKIKSAILIIAILFSSVTIYLYVYNSITIEDEVFNTDEFFQKKFGNYFIVKYPQLTMKHEADGEVYLFFLAPEGDKYINSKILIFRFYVLMLAIILWQLFLIVYFYEKFLLKHINAFDEAARSSCRD